LVLPGYTASQATLARLVGPAEADWFWEQSVAAVALVRSRVQRHAIACDCREGTIVAALKPSHLADLEAEARALHQRFGTPFELLDATAIRHHVASERYCGGVRDPLGAHVNPLALTQGLADVARAAGARLHGQSRVTGVDWDAGRVTTAAGSVLARTVVLATNAAAEDLAPELADWLLPATTYMSATQPLGADTAATLLPTDQGVADSAFVMDYFRRSSDHRLLFGGGVSYFAREPASIARRMKAHLVRVFPTLADIAIDIAWSGRLDVTLNRMVLARRLGTHGLTMLGFSGHGLALTVAMGAVLAEAAAGQPDRFTRIAAVPHRRFPGGRWLRAPGTALGVTAMRLWDQLSR
jgi:gamma-glutamylputrescine oxidase